MGNKQKCSYANKLGIMTVCSEPFIEGEKCPMGYDHIGEEGYFEGSLSLCPVEGRIPKVISSKSLQIRVATA